MYDVVIVSGGFDPVHKGHVRMIQSAATKAKRVIVGVNSDAWLRRKKGKEFMSHQERIEIMSAFKGVYRAVAFNDDDNSASDLIRQVRYDNPSLSIAFANGGDRTSENIPETKTCVEYEVDMIWSAGGEKIQSSSDLIEKAKTS